MFGIFSFPGVDDTTISMERGLIEGIELFDRERESSGGDGTMQSGCSGITEEDGYGGVAEKDCCGGITKQDSCGGITEQDGCGSITEQATEKTR